MVEFVEKGKAIIMEEKPLEARLLFCVLVIYFCNNCVFRYVEELKPFHRGKIEIIEINNRDLNESEFLVKVLRRGTTWLTAGMHKSLQQAFKITQSVEERQSIIAPAWKRSPAAWAISTRITLETAGSL
jgi:glucose-1-phosphate thymidylyltransferase